MLSYSQNKQIWNKLYDPSVKGAFKISEQYLGLLNFFIDWQKKEKIDLNNKIGLDVGCGLGANILFLAEKGLIMTGLDYSKKAIERATELAEKSRLAGKITYAVHDVTKKLPIRANSVDFIFDVFTTSSIKGESNRQATLLNLTNALKKGGYLVTLQVYDGFESMAKEVKEHPGDEPGSALEMGSGPQTKVFSGQGLLSFYQQKLTKVIFKEQYLGPNNSGRIYRPVYLAGIFKQNNL